MEKIEIVYIGEKPFKKDTVAGTRLIFPKEQPVPTPSDVAYRLLAHPTVWIRAEELEAHLATVAELGKQQRKEEEALQKQEAELQMKMDMTCGEYGDIGKLTAAQLRTLVEGAELAIEPQGAQEKVDAFRLRVRDALREKISAESGGE